VYFRIRAFFVFLIISLFLFPAVALGKKDTVAPVTGEPSKVSDMFFEVLRYDVTGVSDFTDIEKFAGVSRYPSKVLLCIIWQKNMSPRYLIEKAVPSYTGKLDSTFSPENFLKTQDYSWIDAAVDDDASEKAGKAIEALEMQAPEEIQQAGQETDASGSEKDGTAAEESPSERRYRDSEGRLRQFSYGTEYLSVSGSSEKRILINAEGKTMTRRFYDNLMRLAKKETWNIAGSSAESEKIRTDVYYYNDTEERPFSSVSEIKSERIESLYNEKGLIYSQTNYSVGEMNSRRLESRTLWKYNSNNRITEEECTLFQYDADKEMELTGKSIRKDVYEYTVPGRVPDYFYYEDNTLRMKTIYTDDDTYITTLYFDNNFTVITKYRHGRKSEETFIRGNRIVRNRRYGD
jgi:hypothetical protein